MKKLYHGLALGSALFSLASGGAHSEEVRPLLISGFEEAAVICVGDEERPAKFGGYLTEDATAQVFIPARDVDGGLLETVLITVSDGERSGQIDLSAFTEEGTIELNQSANRTCNPDRLVEIEAHIEQRRRTMDRVAAYWIEANDSDVITPRLVTSMLDEIDETAKTAMARAGISAVLPSAQDEALQKAISDLRRRQETKDRNEAFERAVNALGEAAREYARQREEKRRQALEAIERERQRVLQEQIEAEERNARMEAAQYCFGALGSGCGALDLSGVLDGDVDVQFSSCHPNLLDSNHTCLVNVGSWGHDECCFQNPDGWFCDGPGGGDACSDEFWLGTQRFVSPFNWWRRDVNSRLADTDGKVDHGKYCAKPGTIILKDDANRCCYSDVGLNVFDLAAFYLNHQLWTVLTPLTRKCGEP